MNNKEVSSVLDDIADILEILGESRFKIQAYRRASNQIRSMGEDINKIDASHQLQSIHGVGKSIAEKIDELLKTGTMQYFEELKEQVPPSVLQLMEIPTIGPKKAKMFYEKLSILSVDELLEAAEGHKLKKLPGISEKTEQNIIDGINQLRTHRERTLLYEALPLATEIIEQLRGLEYVDRADYAGSMRRMRETIGDIDILTSSKETDRVSEAFCEHDRVDRVLARGGTKCSVLTKGGLQIDLRIVDPDVYGAALIYFTGSQQHNIHIRDIAKRRGFKLSEYGLFAIDGGGLISAKEEHDIYKMLDLEYIPPELREDRGEVEAAAANRLPELIEQDDLKGDLHVHSTFSDGINSIDQIADCARRLGYDYVAISDHAENLKIAGGMTRAKIKERNREIMELNDKLDGFTVLSGIELNIDNDGQVDYPEEILREFDLAIASIHTGFNQSREQLTSRITKAMKNPYISIIGHPTGRILGRRFPYELDIEAVLLEALRTGTAMELNSYPDRLDLNDEHLRAARELGVKISINTDAHVSEQMDNIYYGIETARRGWIEKKDVINCLKLSALKAAIKK